MCVVRFLSGVFLLIQASTAKEFTCYAINKGFSWIDSFGMAAEVDNAVRTRFMAISRWLDAFQQKKRIKDSQSKPIRWSWAVLTRLSLACSLRMYNTLVEKCFTDCVDSFRRKDLDSSEEKVRRLFYSTRVFTMMSLSFTDPHPCLPCQRLFKSAFAKGKSLRIIVTQQLQCLGLIWLGFDWVYLIVWMCCSKNLARVISHQLESIK